nr:TRBV1.3 [Sphenodon punctatus]
MLLYLQLTRSGKCLRNRVVPMDFYMLIVFLFSSGFAVKQPPYMVVEKGKSETLTCSQMETQHDNMYWYKQGRENSPQLQLVLSSIIGTGIKVEEEFQEHFLSTETQKYTLSLQLKSARLEDSGTYFCAKQGGQYNAPLFFWRRDSTCCPGKRRRHLTPNCNHI